MNINLVYLLISVILYKISPISYDGKFIAIITIFFLLQSTLFVMKMSKGNYVNFYTLFFVSFYFVNFFYPSVIYAIDPEYFTIFKRNFDHDVINRATALAGVASSSMIYGVSLVRVKDKIKIPKHESLVFNHVPVTYLSLSLYALFVITVGQQFLNGDFTAQSTVSTYLLPLVSSCFLLSSIVFFRDFNYQTKRTLFYISVFLYILLFLSIGDRGPALSLMVVLIALYSHYVKKIKAIFFIPSTMIGMVIMGLIGSGRKVELITSNKNIILRGLEDFDFSVDSFLDMTLDLVMNSWTLYIGYEYAQINGINWGLTLSKFILGVVPFLQGFIESTFSIKLISSGEIFTEIGLGRNSTWGLGTNLVSSVYIAFGLLGCIILFFGLGYLVEKSRSKIFSNNTMWTNIVYFTFVSLSIYYPRTEILTPLKIIVWTYFIYVFLRNLKLLNPRTKYS